MWLLNVPASRRRLETLDMGCFVQAPEDLQALLNACPALRTLTITALRRDPVVYCEFPFRLPLPHTNAADAVFLPTQPVSGLDFSSTPQLRELRIGRIPLGVPMIDRIPWVRSIFASTATPLPLRHLVLEIEYYVGAILGTLLTLDTFFSGPMFPFLQQLTVQFSTQGLQSAEIGAIAQRIRAQFPTLRERNVVEVICVAKRPSE